MKRNTKSPAPAAPAAPSAPEAAQLQGADNVQGAGDAAGAGAATSDPEKDHEQANAGAPGPDAEKSTQQTADTASAGEVTVYPLRSYDDMGKRRRRGGPGYAVPKRHAADLAANKLATTDKPKA